MRRSRQDTKPKTLRDGSSLPPRDRILEQLFETTQEGYWLVDTDAVTLDVNSAMCAFLGQPKDALIGRSALDIMDAKGREILVNQYRRRRMGEKASYEITLHRPDGTAAHCICSASPIHDDNGAMVGSIGLWTDITERKEIEEISRRNEERSRAFAESSGDWFWEMGPDLRFRNVAVQLVEDDGFDRAFIVGGTRTESAGEDVTTEKWRRHLQDLDERKSFQNFRFYQRDSDGRTRYISTSGRPTFNSDGEFSGYIGVASDLTAQLEAENEAQLANDRLVSAIDSISETFVIWGEDGRLVVANDEFRRLNASIPEAIVKGTPFETMIRALVEKGIIPEASGHEEEWIQERLRRRANPGPPLAVERQDGRWLLMHERRMANGSTTSVGTDITLLKQQEAALQEARHEADKANQAKSEFLSSMSHELRTPMNAILGFTQLLATDPDEPLSVDQTESVKYITKAADHLLALIDQVLDLSRIEAGSLQLSIEDVSLGAVLDECRPIVDRLVAEQGIKVDIETPTNCWVRADRVRVGQMLINLLSNGIKYNREGGAVSVRISTRSGESTRISVADTGMGIPYDEQDQVFLPFRRLGPVNPEIEGTGIGLTITRRIVEAMGGRIGFESEPGIGSTFWIELPRVAERLSISDQEISACDAMDVQPGAGGKILYVEDNPANLELVRSIIKRKTRFSLVTAHNAEIGIEVAKHEKPDLILMDINLPGMNGIEALKSLQQTPELATTPVVALSAAAMKDDVERGSEVGFAAYLTKPIDLPEFIGTLDRILGDSAPL